MGTEYDIPIETVETVEMDLTTKNKCIEDNEDIAECAAIQSSSVSFEETHNEYDDPELEKVYRKYITDNSNSLQPNTEEQSNSFDELSIDKDSAYFEEDGSRKGYELENYDSLIKRKYWEVIKEKHKQEIEKQYEENIKNKKRRIIM